MNKIYIVGAGVIGLLFLTNDSTKKEKKDVINNVKNIYGLNPAPTFNKEQVNRLNSKIEQLGYNENKLNSLISSLNYSKNTPTNIKQKINNVKSVAYDNKEKSRMQRLDLQRTRNIDRMSKKYNEGNLISIESAEPLRIAKQNPNLINKMQPQTLKWLKKDLSKDNSVNSTILYHNKSGKTFRGSKEYVSKMKKKYGE